MPPDAPPRSAPSPHISTLLPPSGGNSSSRNPKPLAMPSWKSIPPHRIQSRSGSLTLGAVLGSGLLAVGDALGIEDAADDMVADAGQVTDPAASDENDGVFLQVVTFTG